MKLLVYVLSALLLISAVSAGKSPAKQEIDISELENNSDLRDALKYGINWIFQKAADKYGTARLNIEVTKVNSIYKWKQNKNTYYSFDVEATNNKDANITSNYTIRCSSSGYKVTQWKYNIDYSSNPDNEDCEVPDAGENVELDIEDDVEVPVEEEQEEEEDIKCKEIDASILDKDSHLKAALDHGVNWIFKKAHEKFNISKSGVNVTKVNSICSYQENGSTYYSFDVEAENEDCDTVKLKVNVKCESDGDLRVVNEWSYNIDYADKSDDNTDDQNTDTENECNVEVDIEIDVEVDVENGGYCAIPISECETELIRDIIDEAIEYVTCEETKKIPKGDYYLKDIVSAERKTTDDADYYKFEVKVENADGSVKIDLRFISEVKGGASSVESYWFQVTKK